jgi:hypothetical protein
VGRVVIDGSVGVSRDLPAVGVVAATIVPLSLPPASAWTPPAFLFVARALSTGWVSFARNGLV